MADATPPQPPSGFDEIRAILKELAERDKELAERDKELAERDRRLAERHEALAQSVELFHHDLQEFRARAEADAKNILALAGIARDALASIQSLERIATAHQTRLDGREKRIDDLEK